MQPTSEILLIDRDLEDAEHLRDLLAQRRHAVRHVTSISAALEAIQPEAYGLVLLDLPLSEGETLDVITRLREAAEDIPIIVLSPTADENLFKDAVQHGAQEVLVKDQLDPRLLAQAIVQAIERERLVRGMRKLLDDQRARMQDLRAILDASDEAMVVHDNGRILLANREAQHLGMCERADLPEPWAELARGYTPRRLQLPMSDGQVLEIEVKSREIGFAGRNVELLQIRRHGDVRYRGEELEEESGGAGRLGAMLRSFLAWGDRSASPSPT